MASIARSVHRPLHSRILQRCLLALLLCASSGFVRAIDDKPPKLEPVPDGAPVLGPAPALGRQQQGVDDAPAITIRRAEGAEFKEYRVRGRLYAVRVTPSIGKPYWLIDHNGDGTLMRYDGPAGNLNVPQWLILEW